MKQTIFPITFLLLFLQVYIELENYTAIIMVTLLNKCLFHSQNFMYIV